MIIPRHYENLQLLHENTLPLRAYYIPASRRMDDLVLHREKSDRFQLLNGTWQFRYYTSIHDLTEIHPIQLLQCGSQLPAFLCLKYFSGFLKGVVKVGHTHTCLSE